MKCLNHNQIKNCNNIGIDATGVHQYATGGRRTPMAIGIHQYTSLLTVLPWAWQCLGNALSCSTPGNAWTM